MKVKNRNDPKQLNAGMGMPLVPTKVFLTKGVGVFAGVVIGEINPYRK